MLRRCILIMCLALCLPVLPAVAQGKFSTLIQVGNTAISRYQIEQRARFLTLLGAPGDTQDLAQEQLINEAVQMNTARSAETLPSPEEIEAGMAEFAGRANLDTERFLQAIGQAGVEPETFRDFVTAGLAWRTYVRSTFSDQARASISRDQIGRTLAQTGTEGGLRVLVSEILLPSTTPETALASRARAAEIATLRDEASFAAAARQFSIAPSAPRGGELNWVPLEGLPEEVRGIISALTPGQTSRPVELGSTIGIFHMRDVERVAEGTTETLLVDYALYIVGPSLSEANAVAEEIDTCDDLYGVAKGLPESRLIRETNPVPALPADVRAAITTLDKFETSTGLTRNGNATVLMLCDRKPGQESTVDFDIVGNRLLNFRMTNLAADRLADLRAATTIVVAGQ